MQEGQGGGKIAFQPYSSDLLATHREIPWFRVYADASTARMVACVGKPAEFIPSSAADVRMHCFVHRALLCLLTPRYVYLFAPADAVQAGASIQRSANLVCTPVHLLSAVNAEELNTATDSSKPSSPPPPHFAWRLVPDAAEADGRVKRGRGEEDPVFLPNLACKFFSYVAPANNGFIVEQVLLNLFPNLRPDKQYEPRSCPQCIFVIFCSDTMTLMSFGNRVCHARQVKFQTSGALMARAFSMSMAIPVFQRSTLSQIRC
jgi:hypothetical protein